jgi:hypothetical protein
LELLVQLVERDALLQQRSGVAARIGPREGRLLPQADAHTADRKAQQTGTSGL